MKDIRWTDAVVWSNNPYKWNHVIEITAVQVESRIRGAFVRTPRRVPDKNKLKISQRKPKIIKLICVVDDEIFEQENYVNKMLRVEMGEEFIVTEVKKLDISTSDATWNLKHVSKNKMRVEIKNVVIK